MLINPTKIAMIQDIPGIGLRESYRQILQEFKPDILAFAEYFLVGPEYTNTAFASEMRIEHINQIKAWSLEFNCLIVGGTIVDTENDRNFNRCYLVDKGEILGHYDKIHLYRNEGGGQITPGHEHQVFLWKDFRIGLLICADVLYPESFQAMRELEPDLIFIPTTSPYKPAETTNEKFTRDNKVFAGGAAEAGAILIKVCASGKIIGHPLQGRSLIASPNKILWRIDPQDEDKRALILATLSGDSSNPSLDITVRRG
jgi:predicted amidohydrolase